MIQWIRIILFIVTLVVSTSATQQSFQVVADLDKAYVTDPGLCDNGSKVRESQSLIFFFRV